MKKLIIIILVSFASTSWAQFELYPTPPNMFIYGAYFISDSKAVIFDQQGYIHLTEDAGATYDSIYTGYMSWVNTMHYVSDNEIYVGGGANFPVPGLYPSSLIQRTNINFSSFDSLYADYSGSDITEIGFADENNGMFIGAFMSYMTSDGGATYDTLQPEATTISYNSRNSLEYITPDSAFLLNTQWGGLGQSYILVYRTIDGGSNWETIYTDTLDGNPIDGGLSFVNPLVGFGVSTNGRFIKTSDGGDSWTSQTIDESYRIRDVEFFNETIGVICLADTLNESYLFQTSDAGDTWTEFFIADSFSVNDMQVVDQTVYVHNWEKVYKMSLDSTLFTGLEDAIIYDINVYPNPTSDYLKIETEENIKDLNYQLVSLSGRTVQSARINSGVQEISLEQLNTGHYFLKLFEGEHLFMSKKIVKQ